MVKSLYEDIHIDCRNISVELTGMTHDDVINDIPLPTNSTKNHSKNSDTSNVDSEVNSSVDTPDNNREVLNEEEVEDPLNEHRSPATETCLQSIIPDPPILSDEHTSNNSTGREIYNIAPGENKH